MAIVLGVLVGVLYIIPYFQYVTLLPVILVCLIDSLAGTTQFWTQFGRVCACVCCESMYLRLYPHTQDHGKAMGLNPAIILLSLSVWGSLLGLIGMIIALPLTTLIFSYYRRYVSGEETTDAQGQEEPS